MFKIKNSFMCLLIALAGLKATNGENAWLDRQDQITKTTYSILTDSDPKFGSWGADVDGNQDFSLCRFNVSFITKEVESRLNNCHQRFGDGVLILGDSHAKDLFGMVASRFDHEFLVGITSTHGCRPHTPKDICPYDGVVDFVSKANVFNHIIYEQAGFYLMLDGDKKGHRTMLSKFPLNGEIVGISLDVDHINGVISFLYELSAFTDVTWFGSRLEPHISDNIILQNKCDYPYSFRLGLQDLFNRLDGYIENKVSNTDIRFLSQNRMINYDFPSDFMNCENTLWDDGDHLSAYGEEILGKRLPDDFLIFN